MSWAMASTLSGTPRKEFSRPRHACPGTDRRRGLGEPADVLPHRTGGRGGDPVRADPHRGGSVSTQPHPGRHIVLVITPVIVDLHGELARPDHARRRGIHRLRSRSPGRYLKPAISPSAWKGFCEVRGAHLRGCPVMRSMHSGVCRSDQRTCTLRYIFARQSL